MTQPSDPPGNAPTDKADATDALLAEVLKENPELVDAAKRVFDYAKFLLDDDEKLTKTGALNGEARDLLRKRITEVLP
jgi:hypothetical protein